MAMNVNQTRRLINRTRRILKEQQFNDIQSFYTNTLEGNQSFDSGFIDADDKFVAITSPEVGHLRKFVTGVKKAYLTLDKAKEYAVFSNAKPEDYMVVYKLLTSDIEKQCITGRQLFSLLNDKKMPIFYTTKEDPVTAWFLNSTLYNEGNIQDLADDLAQNGIKLQHDINQFQWLTLVLLGG
jgi:hypothetical protein